MQARYQSVDREVHGIADVENDEDVDEMQPEAHVDIIGGGGRMLLAMAVSAAALIVVVAVAATSTSTGIQSSFAKSERSSTYQLKSEATYSRKEIRQLSDDELADYFDAIWSLKETGRQDGRGYLVYYDDFVAQHAVAASNVTQDQAHLFAAFTVWHSLLTYEFEIALRSINPNVSIPYWDWTIDQAAGDVDDSVIFTDKYFGKANETNEYIVDNGPMAYFPITKDYEDLVWWVPVSGYLRSEDNDNPAPYVTRGVGLQEKNLPSTKEWDDCLRLSNYSSFWICMWGTYGSYANASMLHGGVHLFAGGEWVNSEGGGAVGDFFDSNTSPNDPIWWSHHANLDRLWYQWKLRSGDALSTEDDYCGGYYGGQTRYPQPVGHNLWNVFSPPFYAFRTIEEISTLGGLSVNEACYYFNAERMPYSYE